MKITKETRKAVKFNRLRDSFGCGYWSVCIGENCPCEYKNHEQADPTVYKQLKEEFEYEGKELFGA